jgi:Domain of unknown function (DUF4412)
VPTYFAGDFTVNDSAIKIMKRILMAVSMAAALAGATVWAQGGRGGPPGMSASMAKLFGDNKAFAAKVMTTIKSSSDSSPMEMQMQMFMLDGKTRVETDMSKMKGAGMTPDRAAQMKQMGMDKSVNIIRPDKKIMYIVFSGMSAYAEMPMTDKQVADAMDNSKIEKTSLGKETIDGHSCEKSKVIITGENGEKHEVLVWNATDLKNFPIQMQMEDKGNTILMKYSDLKLEKPDAKLFEPPADFTKYSSPQALMQGEMMKRAGGGHP